MEIAGNGADPQEWFYPVKVDMKDLKLDQGFCEIVQSIRLRDDAIGSRVRDQRIQDSELRGISCRQEMMQQDVITQVLMW